MKTCRRQRWAEAGRYKAPGRCRWCGQRVPRFRSFCGPACRREIRIRCEPRYARRQVGLRDKGKCALCGCDTLKLYRVFRLAAMGCYGKGLLPLWRELGFSGHWTCAGDRWQADHITPVVKGGGGCGLDNLRTLCTPCHKAETAALCRDLAARRRDATTAADAAGDEALKIGNAFPSKYLKAANIPDGQTAKVRIDRVESEDVSGKGEDPKPVLYFIGKDKGMVLNKTNARVIEAAYGDETDDWHGKPLEIGVGETQFAGDMVPCLRVKVPKTGGNSAGARPAPKAEPSPVSADQQFEESDIPF